ncbi:MAG: hypothetical protein AB1500_09390 [Bacillota bacterium]
MTKLEKAFAEASKLPLEEQDLLAAWILEELISEERWGEAFDKSAVMLSKLAKEALEEYRGGRTQELDPDKL